MSLPLVEGRLEYSRALAKLFGDFDEDKWGSIVDLLNGGSDLTDIRGANGAPGGGARKAYAALAANFVSAPNDPAKDVTGCQFTVTATGQPIELVVRGLVSNSGGTHTDRQVTAIVYEGTTQLGSVTVPAGNFPTAGGNHYLNGGFWLTPTAGDHTYKLTLNANGTTDATITLFAKLLAFGLPEFEFFAREG